MDREELKAEQIPVVILLRRILGLFRRLLEPNTGTVPVHLVATLPGARDADDVAVNLPPMIPQWRRRSSRSCRLPKPTLGI